jgi:hypothetical protein
MSLTVIAALGVRPTVSGVMRWRHDLRWTRVHITIRKAPPGAIHHPSAMLWVGSTPSISVSTEYSEYFGRLPIISPFASQLIHTAHK